MSAVLWFCVLPVCLLGLAGCGAGGEDGAPPAGPPRVQQSEIDSDDDGEPTGERSADDAVRDRESVLISVDELTEQGSHDQAAKLLQDLLTVDPTDVELLFRLGTIRSLQGRLEEAVDLLSDIPSDHPDAGLPALGQSADWCFQLERYDEAERRYRELLKQAPGAILARRQLAYLLNRQGRRQEAAVHVRELCRAGDVRQDELHSLIVLTDAMYDDPDRPPGDPQHPYWPIGNSGRARRLFNQRQYVEAAALLQDEVASGQAPSSVVAFYGRAIAEAQNDQQLRWWLARADDSAKEYSDYWAAVGAYLLSERRFEEAARALMEALDRDPTDLMSAGRLQQSLVSLGDDANAEKWRARWRAIREVLRSNNKIAAGGNGQGETSGVDTEAIADVASRLFALDRRLEAVMWKSIELSYRGASQSEMLRLNAQRQNLLQLGQGFQDKSQRLCGMDSDRFPLPDLKAILESESSSGDPRSIAQSPAESPVPVTAHFENIAPAVGIDHAFAVAAEPQDSGFAIYQFFGGAAAVLDFDLDGLPDLYFGQGGADPPRFQGKQSNRLYRNGGPVWQDVTSDSGTGVRTYSTGITVGDWNQDGFVDLAVANLGDDWLFINNGDGTFARHLLTEAGDLTRVPTSMAMADLTGDALPDLFQVAYVHDPDFTKRPATDPSGAVIQALVPTDFSPGEDRLLANDGTGAVVPLPWDEAGTHASTSLGVVVAGIDDQPGNEVFIGNDLGANQYWVREAETGRWSEMAGLLGCGYGYLGGATASMGIAGGDFDGTGTFDIHITNYQNECACLFLGRDGAFRDRVLQFGLDRDSQAVLGFGTQAIDYDNDSRLDLVVTNGHVEREKDSDDLFEQPLQIFQNGGGRFWIADVEDPSGYSGANHLGRALATADFDRDGRTDFVVTHLGERSAVMINQTPGEHHWFQLRLVGRGSERDAIGARVVVRFADGESTAWVTAGDGYFCRNESVLAFGLGKAAAVDEIEIRWPSGQTQTFPGVPVDHRWGVVEGDTELFLLDRPSATNPL